MASKQNIPGQNLRGVESKLVTSRFEKAVSEMEQQDRLWLTLKKMKLTKLKLAELAMSMIGRELAHEFDVILSRFFD